MEGISHQTPPGEGWYRLFLTAGNLLTRERLLLGAELLLIAAWTLLITRPYLDLDPNVMPAGREYGQAIMANHLWTGIAECGWCGLWFGAARGGSPAFADISASAMHPLVVLTTLGWGVLNGSKLALVGAFFMAGLAQWLLAYVLRLGWIARVWSAIMGVSAGHLAARMELGAFSIVIATAACALVLPALLALARTYSYRAVILLAVALAQAALAGQAYLQVGLAFTMPALLLLLPWGRQQLVLFGKRFGLAVGLALLLAAPFVVPFFHFLSKFGKDTDPTFHGGQPFSYVPLNLVISDHAFFATDVLEKFPYPAHYANYVGWLVALLAVWALRGHRDDDERRAVRYLFGVALITLWVSSGQPLLWLSQVAPSQLVTGLRYPAWIAGLAVPAILALAAVGLDRLVRSRWPRISIGVVGRSSNGQLLLDPRWFLVIPLVLAIGDVRVFSSRWITAQSLPPEVHTTIEALRTEDLQWVNVPRGEHFFTEPAVGAGLKLADDFRTWHWRDRPFPEPLLEAARGGPPAGVGELVRTVDRMNIYSGPPGHEYASIAHADGHSTCSAQGSGGNIDVMCDSPQSGVLVVKENSWNGWYARVDGQPVRLRSGNWLSVDLPAGRHTVQFRYRPWDVPLGLALSLVGLVLAGYLWFRPPSPASQA